jgi:hypothetical protein
MRGGILSSGHRMLPLPGKEVLVRRKGNGEEGKRKGKEKGRKICLSRILYNRLYTKTLYDLLKPVRPHEVRFSTPCQNYV